MTTAFHCPNKHTLLSSNLLPICSQKVKTNRAVVVPYTGETMCWAFEMRARRLTQTNKSDSHTAHWMLKECLHWPTILFLWQPSQHRSSVFLIVDLHHGLTRGYYRPSTPKGFRLSTGITHQALLTSGWVPAITRFSKRYVGSKPRHRIQQLSTGFNPRAIVRLLGFGLNRTPP